MPKDYDSIEAELELLTDELLRLQDEKLIDEEEIDVIKALVASIAMKRLDIDGEIILSQLFKGGKPITWH
ncbi:MAG: hypothetical protein N2257_04090 [Thermodesulfovibrionales bacterium]|nr:hypothetical protein [Thermodesulfovibrionales bacterium]